MWQEIRARPLVVMTLCFAFGLAGRSIWPLAILPYLFLIYPPSWGKQWLVGASILAGLLLGAPPPQQPNDIQPFESVCRVTSVPTMSTRGQRVWMDCNGLKVRAYLGEDAYVNIGQRIRVKGEIGPFPEGTFVTKDASAYVQIESFEPLSRGSIWARAGHATEDNFSRFIKRNCSKEVAAFLRAACFNQTEGITNEDWNSYRRSGTTHVLATSGVHVMAIGLMVFLLLRLLPIPREHQLILLMAILMIYGFAAGMRPPILRSILMFVLVSGAYLLRRQADGLSALAGASLIGLVLDRSLIYDLGFLLSILSVSSLILYLPPSLGKQSPWKNLILLALIPWLATSPLIAQVFGEISLISVVSNIVVIPLVSLIVILSLVAWATSWIIPVTGGWLLGSTVTPLVIGTEKIIEFFANLPLASIGVLYIPPWLTLIVYVGLLFWRRDEK